MTTGEKERTRTEAVTRFLDAIERGEGIPSGIFAADAVLDGTVPDWRMTIRGEAAIRAQFSGWYDAPGRFVEVERLPVPDGEFVRFGLESTDSDGTYKIHQAHLFHVVDGEIATARVWCGGRWHAERLAEIAAAG
ncbi:MAG: nuclear transport factor 2 family protein [Frankiaceae bacterium]|nr:nuclear transport factor 2 family protein [Frankiaceae bacterium]MBV9871029.1 nuclear transport factor 2 family protein [Frankiaceae bacterium]